MILDSSAVIAILFREEGYQRLADRLNDAVEVSIGAPTLVEVTIVASVKLGADARGMVDDFVREGGIHVLPLTQTHAAGAVEAWWRYGKGRHRAALNFGDCLTYAVARHAGRPLLCCGDDFGHTDLTLA